MPRRLLPSEQLLNIENLNKALVKKGWDLVKFAQVLGIDPVALGAKMKKPTLFNYSEREVIKAELGLM